jgi:hypothetical protein
MSATPHDDTPRLIEFPDFEQLRRTGWMVNAVVGRYCVAFRGPEEVVLVWRDGAWHQVAGRGTIREVA